MTQPASKRLVTEADISDPTSAAGSALATSIVEGAPVPGTVVNGYRPAWFSERPSLPPTVTLSAASAATGIPGAVQFVVGNNAALRWTGVSGPSNSGTFYYYGAVSWASESAVASIDTIVTGRRYEPLVVGNGAGRAYWLIVDGKPLTPYPQLVPNSGGSHRLMVDFGVTGRHHVRLLTNCGIEGMAFDEGGALTAPTIDLGRNAIYVGDSFSIGANGAAADIGAWLTFHALAHGFIPVVAAKGGTGYVQTAGKETFGARLAGLLAASLDPARIVVMGCTNDGLSGLQAAVTAFITSAQTKWPGVPIDIFGCQYPAGPVDTSRDAKDAAVAAAVAAASGEVNFFSTKTWFTADEATDYITNQDPGDLLHPTTFGHRAIGARAADDTARVRRVL